ncbi:MAG: BACON domain-containing carbohydrate-binding protein, partial [Bacteroidales bacterium]
GYQTEEERTTREMTLLKNASLAVGAELAASGLDFDQDNDGKIDNICFIIQGAVEGWNDLLWPHMWALYTDNVVVAGARVYNFNFQLSSSFGASVLCHEMSHTIGFPDLYHYTDNHITPVGPWDLMANNTNPPQHQSAYQKQKYGHWFSSLPGISTSGTYSLSPLSTDAYACYAISSPNSTSEFFVVEYRKSEGVFESGLPASGLIISRVNPAENGNSAGPPDEVYVFRPDGTVSANGSVYSANFCTESGRTSFTATSNPSCFLSDGSPAGIEITNIGTAGSTISFTVTLGSTPPALTVTPDSRNVASTAGTTTFSVTNTGGGSMAWTAAVTTGATWVHLTSGASGTNTGTIGISLDANPDNATRTGVVTVTATGATGSPKTVTIVQAANLPVLNVLPASRSVAFEAGTTTFDVTNTGGGTMAWTAAVTTGPTWVHITSGASGTNTGTISVSVDANTNNTTRTGVITVTATGATGSPKTVNIVQDANPPVLNVLPASRSIDFQATTTTFDVTNSSGGSMIWTAAVTTGATWVHIISGASGTNTGTISVSVDANPDNTSRTGVITVTASGATGSPKTVNIAQDANPPVLNVLPASRSISFPAGSTTFEVTNSSGGSMAWTAAVTTGATWIHIISGASGTNTGTISVSVDTNTNNSTRTGVITVTAAGATGSPKTVNIVQDPNPPVLNVLPTSRLVGFPAGTTTFEVTNSSVGSMSWTAAVTAGQTWVHITSGTSGSNTGTISVSVDANPDNSTRTGVITVTAAGATGSPKTVTILQDANPPVLNVLPSSRAVDFPAGNTTFEVTNSSGGTMAWTAAVTTGTSWVHINSGSSGTNNGTISVSVDTNPDNATRTGVITVTAAGATGSPKTVTIVQDPNPPVLNVTPSSRSVSFEAASSTFEVTNSSGGNMIWAAAVTTGPTWVHISSGSSGTNTGTISVSVDTNPANEIRTGVITVTAPSATGSPKTVTIVQAPNPPVLNVLPAFRMVDYQAGPTSFEVTNSSGGSMTWLAAVTTGPVWVHITSGSNGINTGTISVTVDANPDYSIRTGVITITAPGATGSPKTVNIVQDARPVLKPDLLITHIAATIPSVTWPEKIQIVLTVANIGENPSTATSIHFYLSDVSMDSVLADLGQISCDVINNGSDWATEAQISFNEDLLPGNYSIVAMVDNPSLNTELNETNNTGSCLISVLNSVQTDLESYRFSVFPNPASTNLTLLFEGNGVPADHLVITDMLGQVVFSGSTDRSMPFRTTIDISSWTKGCYQISLYTKHNLYHKLVILE